MMGVRWIQRVRVGAWVLLSVCLVWLAMNVRWLMAYRRGQLLDIDEAGYLGMALNNYYAGGRDGLDGWLQAVGSTGIQAPLIPALTSLHMYVTGPVVVTSFLVPLLSVLAVVLLGYSLGHRLGGPKLAWLMFAVLASAPAFLIEARGYHFGAPAAAVTTAALYFLIRSEGLTRIGSSIAFGVFLGLMPLTRTMTVAYVAVLLATALVQVIAGAERRRRLVNLGVAVLAAVAVASLWLIPNGSLVFKYLTGFGYGKQSAEYGSQSGLVNPAAWFFRFHQLIGDQYLPHGLLYVAGAIAAIVVLVRRLKSLRFRAFVPAAIGSPVFPAAALVIGGFAALISSPNAGTQFELCLVPALALVVLWGLLRLGGRITKALPVAVGVVVLIALVPQLDLHSPTATPLWFDLPLYGHLPVTDGRGSMQIAEGNAAGTDAVEPVDAETARQWIEASDWAGKQIIANNAVRGASAFGFRDRLFNVNTVQLAVLHEKGYGVAMPMVNPTDLGNTRPDYENWLTHDLKSLSGDASKACLLFTATGTINEFTPAVDPPGMREAAAATGFTPIADHNLPNGRVVTLWHRDQPTCRPEPVG
ncbi:hypothetical protein [Amycolatopsis sp. NPDC059657]|uniref:hypothetical protein n=1 Tax=Amycolatopsis sp. NPDC059657 TaxID=3346899 RepID=UPI0036735A61